jgi:heme exporter protein B
MGALIARDLALRFSRWGGVALPLLFFLLVASLFPFAVGPEPKLLARIAGGTMWVAALLAALMPIDTLFEPDRADGTLDQLAARGLAFETVAAARIISHWLAFGPPLLLTVPIAAALLNLPGDSLPALLVGLAVGTPALAALGVVAAALTVGLRGAGALAGLLVLPLALPVLIFGAGAMGAGPAAAGAFKLLAASSLFLVALSPFAAGAALRAAFE